MLTIPFAKIEFRSRTLHNIAEFSQSSSNDIVVHMTPEDKQLGPQPDEFSNAVEMTSLEDASRAETSKKHNPEVAIDVRRVGNTILTGIMGTHTNESGPSIARALSNCDIVTVEGPGVADRAAYEAAFTRLISSDLNNTDPSTVDAAFAKLLASGYDGTTIFSALRGSDKTVVFLDLDRDDADYPKVEADKAAREQYAVSLTNLDTVATTRGALLSSLNAAVEAHAVREPAMKEQLGNLITQSEHQNPPLNIGVRSSWLTPR
jgi:hypothetical protein